MLFLFGIFISSSDLNAQPLSGILPKYDANVHQTQVNFQWNSMPSAIDYTVVLAQDPNFTLNLISSPSISTTSWTSGVLPWGIWYWKVIGNDGNSNVTSAINRFNHFIPSESFNTSLWLSAGIGLSLDVNGRIQSWTDQSQNGYVLNQTDANKRPFNVATSFNGLPTVNFQGAHSLSGGDILDLGNSNRTAFVIGNFNGTNQTFFAKSNSVVAPSRYAMMRLGTQSTIIYQEAADNHLISPTSTTSFALLNWENNRTSALNKLNLNNTNIGIKALDPNYNFQSTFRFLVGAFNGSNDVGEAFLLNGNISEIVFVDNYSAADQEAIQKYLKHKYTPELNLGADITNTGFCPTNLTATGGYTSLVWSTGATSNTISVSEPGVYWVRGTDQLGFISYDTIKVNYPNISVPNLTGICLNSSITWDPSLGTGYTYLWSNGQTTSTLQITAPGNYFVKVTDAFSCFKYSDTINFTIDNYENIVYIGADTSLCSGNTIQLQAGASETISYLWGGGSSAPNLVVNNTGNYWVETTNTNGCIGRDTIFINIVGVAPIAQFSANDVCDQNTVTFNDLSTPVGANPIDSWNWDFGDGQLASSQNASHLYSNPGNYLVELFVSQNGCGAYFYDTVKVFAKPDADYSYTGYCQGATIQFTDESVLGSAPISNYFWDFDMPWTGAYNNSIIPVPNRAFSDEGTYNVKFTITDSNGCSDSITKTVVIDPTPQTSFSVNNSCQNQIAQIINNTPVENGLQYAWSFGDNTNSNQANPDKIYSLFGTYLISLDITNTFGCTGSQIETIIINPEPLAQIDLGPACFGSFGNLNDISTVLNGSIDSSFWLINSTDSLFGSQVIYEWTSVGQQQIELVTFSNTGCSDYNSIFIDITDTLDASFESGSSVIAAGDPVNFINTTIGEGVYLWNFDDGNFSNEVNPIHTFTSSYIDSNLTITLIAMNSSGCIDSLSANLSILAPIVDIAMQQLFISESNGWYNVGVNIKNTGTTNVTHIPMSLETEKGLLFNESFDGNLYPSSDTIYVFSGKPVILENLSDMEQAFICIDGVAFSVNGLEETNLTDNRLCENLKDETVVLLTVFPNPVQFEMNISFLVSENSDLSLKLYDSQGRLVKDVVPMQNLDAGTYSYKVYLDDINSGIYFLQMESGLMIYTQHILVQN